MVPGGEFTTYHHQAATYWTIIYLMCGDTHIYTVWRRHSRRTGLRTRSSFNQTTRCRCISPPPGTRQRPVHSRIWLRGNLVVRPIPLIWLTLISSHLRPLRIGLEMDPLNPTGVGTYAPLHWQLSGHLHALCNTLQYTNQIPWSIWSDLDRLGIWRQGRHEWRGTLPQIPRHRDRHKSNGGRPALQQAQESNAATQVHTPEVFSNTEMPANHHRLLVVRLQIDTSQPHLPSLTLHPHDIDIANSPHPSLVRDPEGPHHVADVHPGTEFNLTPTPPIADLTAMDNCVWTEWERVLFCQTRWNPVWHTHTGPALRYHCPTAA